MICKVFIIGWEIVDDGLLEFEDVNKGFEVYFLNGIDWFVFLNDSWSSLKEILLLRWLILYEKFLFFNWIGVIFRILLEL